MTVSLQGKNAVFVPDALTVEALIIQPLLNSVSCSYCFEHSTYQSPDCHTHCYLALNLTRVTHVAAFVIVTSKIMSFFMCEFGYPFYIHLILKIILFVVPSQIM